MLDQLLPPPPVLPPQFAAPGPAPSSAPSPVTQTALPPSGEFRHRVEIDGVPYKGPPLMLRDNELASVTHRVSSHVTKVFNVTDAAQQAELTALLDRVSRDNALVRQYQTRWARNRETGAVEMFVYLHVEFVTLQLNENTERGKMLMQGARLSGKMGEHTALDAQRTQLNSALGSSTP